jgi:hypothetical protein
LKRKGKWGIVLRRLAYERTGRPPDPTADLKLDQALLAQSQGYRHLAIADEDRLGGGFMPGLDGPDLDALYAKGEAWLKGRKL